jgi:hypothetical protein
MGEVVTSCFFMHLLASESILQHSGTISHRSRHVPEFGPRPVSNPDKQVLTRANAVDRDGAWRNRLASTGIRSIVKPIKKNGES